MQLSLSCQWQHSYSLKHCILGSMGLPSWSHNLEKCVHLRKKVKCIFQPPGSCWWKLSDRAQGTVVMSCTPPAVLASCGEPEDDNALRQGKREVGTFRFRWWNHTSSSWFSTSYLLYPRDNYAITCLTHVITVCHIKPNPVQNDRATW